MSDKYSAAAAIQAVRDWIKGKLTGKQDTLVSGTNIKTINGYPVLGHGNINVQARALIAKEGSTLPSEIRAAWHSNETVVVAESGKTIYEWLVVGIKEPSSYVMVLTCVSTNTSEPAFIQFVIQNNVWSRTSVKLQKQLTSGVTIKTVNNKSLLGSGNIDIQGGGGDVLMAVPNVTTYAELVGAVNAHKVIYVQSAGVATGWDVVNEALHYTASGGYVHMEFDTKYCIVKSDNTWTIGELGTATGLVAFDTIQLDFLTENDSYISFRFPDQIYPISEPKVFDSVQLFVQTNEVSSINLVSQNYTDSADAALQAKIDALGEPFRVKNWAGSINVEIPCVTEDLANTAIPKMTFSISGEEGEQYQIVGMIAYEVFDAASGGNRINCWPVCQFTGNGQKELSVRWMCGGTTRKTAKRINAWVLLKHR